MACNKMVSRAKKLYAEGYSIRKIEQMIGSASRMTIWRWIHGRHDGPDARYVNRKKGSPMKLPKVEGDGPVYPDVDPEDKDALIARLQLENDILRGVNDILKVASLREMANSQKTSLIDYLRRTTSHPLKELIAFLKISKSSYEYQHKAQMRPDKYADLRVRVRNIFEIAGKSARGYRFVVDELRSDDPPLYVSEKVVRRIMREENLVPVWMKKKRRNYSSYAGEISKAPDNLVKRDFKSALPNFLWLTDITEFKLPSGKKVYLSAIRDCFDSSIVSWKIGRHATADLANQTLLEACKKLKAGERPVIHSDRGSHYRWPGWVKICEKFFLVRSMSAKGCSPDNAAMEGFFGLLKKEFYHGRDWEEIDVDPFIAKLDSWISEYNQVRKCGALGYVTPISFRNALGRVA